MSWTLLDKGKHKGKTIPQLMFSDPDYFFFAYHNGLFTGSLATEANEVFLKACNIKVPRKANEEEIFVKYVIHRPSVSFGDLQLLPKSDILTPSNAYYSKKIDMSYPRKLKEYDKKGYKIFLRCLKKYLFGDPNYKMTKQRCEIFFDNYKNYDL